MSEAMPETLRRALDAINKTIGSEVMSQVLSEANTEISKGLLGVTVMGPGADSWQVDVNSTSVNFSYEGREPISLPRHQVEDYLEII